ncbi:MAG: ABC transporter permease [Myxococcales bacterium]|nr:ABC transporter permease [Myxococcales bacterium]
MPSASRIRRHLVGYALVLPSMALFAVFFIYPVLHTLYLSFFTWNLIEDPVYDGLGRYSKLLDDEVFREVLLNTLIYSLATVTLTMLGGLALAVLLNRKGRIFAVLQGAIFTSYIVSWVGVSLLWVWMLDPQYGLVNLVLRWIGVGAVDWLGDPDIALWTLVGVTVWKTIGYDMIIYMAGLQSIPDDLYEAASIDGASAWQQFVYITLPQLGPTTLFLLVTSMIMTFQGFDVVKVMTQGGPVNSTSIYVYFVYEQAFELFNVGYASAAVMVFFALVLAVTLAQFWMFDRSAQGGA